MAAQIVNVGVNVSDNGTAKKVIKNVNELHSALEATNRTASKLNVGGSTPKASGYRAAAEPSGSAAVMSNQEYNRGRGAAGGTGASARDFANQAQGLGGIVRLYATYAANVFAVGAAFTALSNAMDTANLVKGLDQLGAASGTALGTLSKRLVEATDGAISLREAMEATAKASSSGMSSENILRMGKVAKQAAQALGVDMADAVNRLTRGITKLEPELLDELGIFTKVDMATQAYAKSVGKSASAITDFEKRMAFANSVLEEGERKFSAIDFETNPYTKLLATLKDVAQTGLELVNTVFAPIVKFLSENPKALMLAIASLGAVLVKQALPALGEFKAGLAAAAEESTAIANIRKKDAEAAKAALDELISDRVNARLTSIAGATDLLKKAGKSNIQAVQELVAADLTVLTEENIASVNTAISAVEAQADAVRRQRKTAEMEGEGPARLAQLKSEEDALRNFAKVNRAAAEDEKRLAKEVSQTNIIAKLNQDVADKANIKRVKDNILANAAYNGSLIGVTGAVKLMNAELNASGLQLNAFSKGMLFARAGLTAFAGAVTTVMAAIGGFMNIIAIAGAVFAALSSMLSENDKEMAAFDSSVNAVDESLKNLSRTLDFINDKPFLEVMNTASLTATSNAVNEISNSVSGLIKNTVEAGKSASGFDKAWNDVKGLFGGGRANNFGEVMSKTVLGAFDRLGDSPEVEKAKNSIAQILDIDPKASTATWEKAFKAIADNEPQLKKVDQAMKALGMSTAQTADDAQQFDLAMKQSKESLKNLTDQFKVKDPLALFAQDIIESSEKTAKAFENPEQALNRLLSVANDPGQLALFSEADQQNIIKYGSQITETVATLGEQRTAAAKTRKEIAELQKQYDKMKGWGQSSDEALAEARPEFAEVRDSLEASKQKLEKQQADINKTQITVATIVGKFPDAATAQFVKGADHLTTSIEASFAKANTAFGDAVLAAAGDIPGIAKQRYEMDMRKLSGEAQLLKAQVELAKVTALNTAAQRTRAAQEGVDRATAEAQKPTAGAKERANLANAEKDLREAKELEKLYNTDPSKALATIKQITAAAKEGNNTIAQNSSEILGYLSSLAGFGLQQLNLADARAAKAFELKLKTQSEQFVKQKKLIEAEKQSNANSLESLSYQKQLNGFLTAEQISEEGRLKSSQTSLDTKLQELAVEQKLFSLELAKKEGGKFAPKDAEYNQERELLLQQKAELAAAGNLKLDQQNLATAKEQNAELLRQFDLSEKLRISKEALDNKETEEKLTDRSRDLQTADASNRFTPEYQKQAEEEIQAAKFVFDAKIQQEQLYNEFTKKNYADLLQLKLLAETGASEAAIAALQATVAAETEAYAKKYTEIEKSKSTELSAIAEIAAARKEANNFDNLISSLQTLEGIFDGMGSAISSTVKAFGDASKAQKQYANSIADIEFERDAAQNPQDRAKFEKQLAQTQRDAAKSEISNYGRVAGAAKGLFKEKTAAYKILAATEKVMHITRLGMDIAEMISDTKKTGVSLANSAMRTAGSVVEAGVDAVAAVIKSIAGLPFPLNIAAGAATAAVVFGLLSQIGGSKSANIAGGGGAIENDGTGTVFGDKSAKSESIPKSLELLTEADPVLMRNSANMLKHLRSIDANISQFGVNLIKSMNGESISANMGVEPGFRDNPVIGVVKEALSAIPLIGGFLGGAIGSIGKALGFGTKVSVTGEGLQLGGQNLQAIIDEGINARFYADVRTKKKVAGITTSDKTRRNYSAVDEDLKLNIQRIFEGFGMAVLEVGEALGFNINTITGSLNNYVVQLQNIKLSGSLENQTKALEAAFGKIGDQMFQKILPGMEGFIKAGEGYMQTAIRVAYAVDEAGATLDRLGIASVRYQDVINKQGDIGAEIVRQSIMAQETNQFISAVVDSLSGSAEDIAGIYTALDTMRDIVVDFGGSASFLSQEAFRAAGGLDELGDSIAEFYDVFSSETLKTQVNTRKVTEIFAQLGLVLPGTREGVLELVNLLSATDPKAAATIIAATSSLDDYYSTLEEVNEKILEEQQSLQDKLFDLTATREQIRQKELNSLDQSNRALQEQIWLVEDQLEISKQRAKLEEDLLKIGKSTEQLRELDLSKLDETNRALQQEIWARQDMLTSLNDTIKKFQTFSKSLRDFRDNLVLGSSSILTPLEKYAESKLQFESTYTKALAGDAEAQGKLTNSAQTFLNASKEYFASSSEYTNDFNSVLAKIGYGITSAEASVSVAELQLNALSTQTDLLSSINTNIAILAGVPQMARGGLATGLTLVGEEGPELVDFNQPGRVYNANQTAGMFVPRTNVNSSMVAVVAELRQVKAEISQLRKQQNQETGHLITATYDAQNKNAEVVTEGVVKATKAQAWAQQAQQAAVVK